MSVATEPLSQQGPQPPSRSKQLFSFMNELIFGYEVELDDDEPEEINPLSLLIRNKNKRQNKQQNNKSLPSNSTRKSITQNGVTFFNSFESVQHQNQNQNHPNGIHSPPISPSLPRSPALSQSSRMTSSPNTRQTGFSPNSPRIVSPQTGFSPNSPRIVSPQTGFSPHSPRIVSPQIGFSPHSPRMVSPPHSPKISSHSNFPRHISKKSSSSSSSVSRDSLKEYSSSPAIPSEEKVKRNYRFSDFPYEDDNSLPEPTTPDSDWETESSVGDDVAIHGSLSNFDQSLYNHNQQDTDLQNSELPSILYEPQAQISQLNVPRQRPRKPISATVEKNRSYIVTKHDTLTGMPIFFRRKSRTRSGSISNNAPDRGRSGSISMDIPPLPSNTNGNGNTQLPTRKDSLVVSRQSVPKVRNGPIDKRLAKLVH